jgi:hypothetical protein
MSRVMPEIAVQRLVQYGIQYLRSNRPMFNEIFAYLKDHPLMSTSYGQPYIDSIWNWFTTEKIPVVQAFLLTPERVPCYSIHLSSENEDESKAAMSDYYGDEEDNELSISCSNVTLDIGIHGSKVADGVLWMYYILSDILFRHKGLAQSMGIEIQTFSASDFQRDNSKLPENIYTRYVKMRLTTFDTWKSDSFEGPYEVEIENIEIESINHPLE